MTPGSVILNAAKDVYKRQAHTTNPVPFLVAGLGDVTLRTGGVLADIAPTMLKILGLPQPAEMTGKSIIELRFSAFDKNTPS